MKRTPLTRKTPMKRTALKRKTPLRNKAPMQRTSTPPKPRKPMKRAGKRTLVWDAIRAELKVAFQAAGITTCEVRGPGCWNDNGLGFGHQKKRRHCTTPELMRDCILVCNPDHDVLEALPEAEMQAAILRIIAARKRPVILTPKNAVSHGRLDASPE